MNVLIFSRCVNHFFLHIIKEIYYPLVFIQIIKYPVILFAADNDAVVVTTIHDKPDNNLYLRHRLLLLLRLFPVHEIIKVMNECQTSE